MTKEEFIKEIKKLGLSPTPLQLEQLEKYYNMLINWNEKINLTRITKKEDVYLKHFYDSLTIIKIIDLKKEETLLDFGTGAGFPGMVLKIMFPNLKVTLLDSLNKRIIFLNEVIKELNLKEIETVHERIEKYTEKRFDVLTTRAVANLSKLIEYTKNIMDKNTKFIPLKGHIEEELQDVENKKLLQKYGLTIRDKKDFLLPKEKSTRTILLIEKRK